VVKYNAKVAGEGNGVSGGGRVAAEAHPSG
jgi:hypothetical protein